MHNSKTCQRPLAETRASTGSRISYHLPPNPPLLLPAIQKSRQRPLAEKKLEAHCVRAPQAPRISAASQARVMSGESLRANAKSSWKTCKWREGRNERDESRDSRHIPVCLRPTQTRQLARATRGEGLGQRRCAHLVRRPRAVPLEQLERGEAERMQRAQHLAHERRARIPRQHRRLEHEHLNGAQDATRPRQHGQLKALRTFQSGRGKATEGVGRGNKNSRSSISREQSLLEKPPVLQPTRVMHQHEAHNLRVKHHPHQPPVHHPSILTCTSSLRSVPRSGTGRCTMPWPMAASSSSSSVRATVCRGATSA